MKKNKKDNYKFIAFIFALSLVWGGMAIGNAQGATNQTFSQEELVNLSRPSVVRIVEHIVGEVTFPSFTLDLDKLTIIPGEGVATKVPVDEYVTGSGFIVSQDGYILTNSHVISDQDVKLRLVSDEATAAIMEASLYSTTFGAETNEPEKFQAYGERIRDYLLKEGVFSFQEKIVVLDPSSKKEKMLDLVADGFPITIVSINNNFNKDNRDIGLIKIEEKNLPALPLGDASSIARGEKIGVFGFPATAELNDRNLLESTFSQGVVSAIKESENKDFKIIQTDAKISDGSSGSPLLDESGQVIGMITYQSNMLDSQSGDNFAFAIPIDVVEEGMKKFNVSQSDVTLNKGQYHERFAAGLAFLHEAKCRAALPEFIAAKNINEKFNQGKNVDTYIKRCEALIASGQTLDTRFDRLRHTLLSLDFSVWLVIVSVLCALISMIALLFALKKQVKKDKKEIILLEDEIKYNEEGDKEELRLIKKIEKDLKENMAEDKKELEEIKKIEGELKQMQDKN